MVGKLIMLSLLVITTSFEVDPIPWQENKKLSWTDFKGSEKPESGAVAVTASGITFSFTLKRTNGKVVGFVAEAEAHFYPENSWYLSGKGDEYILAHEQLHFDITELHVRKLRKALATVEVHPNIRTELQDLHLQANQSLREMQEAYDQQSDNSINREVQLKWEALVAKQLSLYAEFVSK